MDPTILNNLDSYDQEWGWCHCWSNYSSTGSARNSCRGIYCLVCQLQENDQRRPTSLHASSEYRQGKYLVMQMFVSSKSLVFALNIVSSMAWWSKILKL